MTRLHFQHIQGKSLDIINTILHDQELALVDEVLYLKVRLVLDELVTNIVNYAYPDGGNDYLDVELMADGGLFTLRFRDGGIPFNPLERERPDVTLPLSQRSIGGLGIFLVIHKAHAIDYEYTGGENVLTVTLSSNKKIVTL